MKRKERDQLKAMSVAELGSELNKRLEELFKLIFKSAQSVPKNPLRKRILRREVAMLKTWISQRESGAGV